MGGKSKRAHRIAFFLTTGQTDGVVRHSCDTPLCCNPVHLSSGTQADNVADMVARRRCAGVTLPFEDVETIRRRSAAGETVEALAREYGVSTWTVSGFLNGSRRRF